MCNDPAIACGETVWHADCGREPYLDGGLGEWITLAELGLVTRITLCLIGCGLLSLLCIEIES